jgi:pimeloyl-ACP methyl ester carboxylesterase
MSTDVTFANGDVVLAGSLSVPNGISPGVVLVGGSGPSDRDNDTYFPPIRRHLVNAGIAVLSYDKRGVGASSGDWRDGTIDDLAADAVAAWEFLRAQPGVRPDAVGLFGHSEGGWVVLRAAAVTDDMPWVVTNSCPGMTPAAQDRHALANELSAVADVDSVLALYDRVVEAGGRDADFAEMTRLVESAPVAFADFWADVDERMWGFLKRKQDHDPLPDVQRLRCSQLALFGGADELVPVAESVHLFSTTDRDQRATLTVAVFPGANHRVLVDGFPAPGYLTTLSGWITDRTV